MQISKETILKILSDDVENEMLDYLIKAINEESKIPSDEIDYQKICDLMYDKIQFMNGNNNL